MRKNTNKLHQANPILQNERKIDTISVFVDSTKIGTAKSSKISLVTVTNADSLSQSTVCFYSKEDNNWKLKYSFEDGQWSGDVIMPEISDFNNDGFKDFKYLKGTGARGSNGIYNLFIYDKKDDSLFYVVNSNDYPNLYYNKETNSINSYILSGGNETVFLRLEKDSLVPFASVDQYEKQVIVTEYDKKGIPKVIKVDTTHNYEEFANFTNYNPLKVKK